MVNITHSNRTSYHPKRYPIDEYGIVTSALPPHLRRIINELQQIDEQQKNKRTELNKAAERWMQDAGLSFFFDLDEPTGPIAFTKRQGWTAQIEEDNPRMTKVVHRRVKGSIVKLIDNIIKFDSKPQPEPKPKPKPLKLVTNPKHRIAKGYDQRVGPNNPYGV